MVAAISILDPQVSTPGPHFVAQGTYEGSVYDVNALLIEGAFVRVRVGKMLSVGGGHWASAFENVPAGNWRLVVFDPLQVLSTVTMMHLKVTGVRVCTSTMCFIYYPADNSSVSAPTFTAWGYSDADYLAQPIPGAMNDSGNAHSFNGTTTQHPLKQSGGTGMWAVRFSISAPCTNPFRVDITDALGNSDVNSNITMSGCT